MSDEQKACARAEGALDNLIADMRGKLEREGRSETYIATFWENFFSRCEGLGKGH